MPELLAERQLHIRLIVDHQNKEGHVIQVGVSLSVRLMSAADIISLPWRRPFGATDVQPSERCKREANYGN
jgi:hypothetical protein